MGCIYLITCLPTGKYYVGKTLRTPQERFLEHVYMRYFKHGHLSNAIRKYGKDNFIVETLSEGDESLLDNLEKLWIICLNATDRTLGMNIKLGGEGGPIAEETKEKIRQARKGWKPTTITLERMKAAGKTLIGPKNGFFGHQHSDETKQHWRDIRQGSIPWNKGTRKANAKYNDLTKICGTCKIEKPQTDEFFYRESGKLSHMFSSRCKECTKAYVREWKKSK